MLLVYVLFLILTANLCTGKFNAGKYFNSQNMGSGGYSGEPEENNPANGTMYDFIIGNLLQIYLNYISSVKNKYKN